MSSTPIFAPIQLYRWKMVFDYRVRVARAAARPGPKCCGRVHFRLSSGRWAGVIQTGGRMIRVRRIQSSAPEGAEGAGVAKARRILGDYLTEEEPVAALWPDMVDIVFHDSPRQAHPERLGPAAR